MTTVTIVGADRALAAGQWCLENYRKNEWDLEYPTWGSEYAFVFPDPKKATEFILRWQ